MGLGCARIEEFDGEDKRDKQIGTRLRFRGTVHDFEKMFSYISVQKQKTDKRTQSVNRPMRKLKYKGILNILDSLESVYVWCWSTIN